MQIGFDVSDLYLQDAGLRTYSIQLLKHLARLLPSDALTIINGVGAQDLPVTMPDVAKLLVPGGPLASSPYVSARPLPVPSIHLMNGPWKKDYRARRLAWWVDNRLLIPLRQHAQQTR